MELKGVIEKIFETQAFGSNGFQKREFVVGTKDNYPQQIKFELIQDRCKFLDNFNQGDAVVINFDIKGREYNGKYFVNLQAWKVVKDTQPAISVTTQEASVDLESSGGEDDLPF